MKASIQMATDAKKMAESAKEVRKEWVKSQAHTRFEHILFQIEKASRSGAVRFDVTIQPGESWDEIWIETVSILRDRLFTVNGSVREGRLQSLRVEWSSPGERGEISQDRTRGDGSL